MHRAAGLGGTLTGAEGAGEGERWPGEVGAGTVGGTEAASRRVPAGVATERTDGGDGATVGAEETGDVCRNAGAGAGRTASGGSGAGAGGAGEEEGAAGGSPSGTPPEGA